MKKDQGRSERRLKWKKTIVEKKKSDTGIKCVELAHIQHSNHS